MTSIDPGLRVAAAVREQLAALRERSATARGERSAATQIARRPNTVSPALVQRIAALSPDDPQRPRKAVRLYLEAELAREFGATIVNDPAFGALLDAVQDRMNQDAHLAASAESLGQLLVTGKLTAA